MLKNLQSIANSFKTLRLAVIAAFLGYGGTAIAAPLNGSSYTINNAAAASSTNFVSFKSFSDSLTLKGISGPVTVTFLTDQTESSAVTFPAITGASSTNTITIDGNGKFFSVGSSSVEIILFNGGDYFTIKNLTVRNTNSTTTAQGIRFTNASDNNTISKCTIEFTAITSGNTNGGAYIAFASNSTSLTSTTSSFNNGINNTITGCTMRTTNSNSPGPCFAIVVTGNTGNYSSTAQNNTFSSNTIQNFYYMAVFMSYTNGNQVLGNDISRTNATSNNCYSYLYGVCTQYSYASSRATRVDNNNMHDWPYSGVSAGSANGYTYAIYGYYNYGNATYRYTNSGNTIKNVYSYYTYYGIYNYYPYFGDIKNNVTDNAQTYSSGNYFYGIWTYYGNDRVISNNTIKNCVGNYYTYLMWTQYSNNSGSWDYISDNIISNNSTYGYYLYGLLTQWYFNAEISRNKVINNKMTSTYGYFYGISTDYLYNMRVNSNLIANNAGYYYNYNMMLSSYNSGSYTAEIMQNTIQTGKPAYYYHYSYGLYVYLYYHSKVTVKGNIVDMDGSYYAYPAYTYNTTLANITWSDNSYFIRNITGGQQWYYPQGTANNFAGWLSFNWAQNEKQGDPKFNNPSGDDYRSNKLFNQNNVVTVSTNLKDVASVSRNPVKSDRGAFENMLDIQTVSSTFSPPSLICAGYTTSPVVTLKNTFIDTVYDFYVGYSINGVIKGKELVTAKILTGATGTVTLPNISFTSSGATKFKIFLYDADDQPLNDTLTYNFTVTPAPGGGKISQQAGSKGLFEYKNVPGKDVLATDEIIVYTMTAPRKYTDGQYNSSPNGWNVNVWGKDASGNTITSSNYTYSHASGTSVMTFNPDDKYVDQEITLYTQIIDNQTGCDTIYTRKVFVAPIGKPVVVLPALKCDGSDIFFDNLSSISSGALTYLWDFGDGSDVTDATSPVHKFPGFGTYNVKFSRITTPYGFVRDSTITITINEIPKANFERVNACEGIAVTFTNKTTIGSGTLTYKWNFGDGSPISTATNPSRIYTNVGGYSVTLTATSANGCAATITKNAYEFARPKAGFAFSSPGSCDNELFSFANTSVISSGDFGSIWDFNDAGSRSTESAPKYDFLTPGTKNVKLKTISEFGCADSITKTITVKPSPKSDFTNTPACSIDPTQFTNTSVIPSGQTAAYSWNFGDGSPATAVISPVHPWNTPGPKVITLTTTLTSNGCKDVVVKQLFVGVQPDVDFNAADVCAGADVIFENSTKWAQGDISYDWEFGNTAQSNDADPIYNYPNVSNTQTFNVKLKASIVGGCEDSLVKTITINAIPSTCDFDIVYDGTVGHRNYRFVPKGGSMSNIEYTWQPGDGTPLNSNSAGASHTYVADGKYLVKMTAKNPTGCECSQSKVLSIAWQSVNDVNALNQAVSVFPNPNNGKFNVIIDGAVNSAVKVNVYNLLGELVKTQNADSNTIEMDLTAFASGVYMVKVYTGTNVVTKKVTVNR